MEGENGQINSINIGDCTTYGTKQNTVYQLAKEGRLPVIKLGCRLLVPRKALNELLDSCLVSRGRNTQQ